MTIRLPEHSILDIVLKLLGKRRAIFIFKHKDFSADKYCYSHFVKETFLKALFRPKDSPLPKDSFDLFNFPRGTIKIQK